MEETTKKIPLDIIDDPRVKMRDKTDDESLDELMASMRELGLIEPVVLRPVGNRYEVIAGHRRTRAARLLGWALIEAKIIVANDDEVLAMRLAENLMRKDVDPVDEACFIGEIITRYNKTIEDISKILHHSEQWVKERLEIFEMPDYIQAHLKLKKYPLGAALWINRIKDENTKRYYANWADLNGVSVSGAKKWYDDLEAVNFVLEGQNIEIKDEGGQVVRTRQVVRCEKCGKEVFLDEAKNGWFHYTCPSL